MSEHFNDENPQEILRKIGEGKLELRLIIMRGLPGSGKTTKATSFGLPVFSSDDFSVVAGKYKFDPSKIDDNHKKNQERVAAALSEGKSCVVDNTNSQLWEMRPYAEIAIKYSAKIEFSYPETPWRWDVTECAAKCTHGVPVSVIARMKERWEYEENTINILSAARPENKNILPGEKIAALDKLGKEVIEKIHPAIKFEGGKFTIQLQVGHPGEPGSVEGCFPTHAIMSIIELHRHYQALNPSRETALAITNLEQAWLWLNMRKLDREARGVLQTDKK